MKTIDEMTVKEIRKILYEKEQKEQSEVIKTGVLKEDVYCFNSGNYDDTSQFVVDSYYLTKKDREELIDKFSNSFKILYLKGTAIYCKRNGIWCIGDRQMFNKISEEKYIENIQDCV